jgi:hypothetical protein
VEVYALASRDRQPDASQDLAHPWIGEAENVGGDEGRFFEGGASFATPLRPPPRRLGPGLLGRDAIGRRHDAPALHDDAAVGQLAEGLEVVLDDDQRIPLCLQLLQDGDQLRLPGPVELGDTRLWRADLCKCGLSVGESGSAENPGE